VHEPPAPRIARRRLGHVPGGHPGGRLLGGQPLPAVRRAGTALRHGRHDPVRRGPRQGSGPGPAHAPRGAAAAGAGRHRAGAVQRVRRPGHPARQPDPGRHHRGDGPGGPGPGGAAAGALPPLRARPGRRRRGGRRRDRHQRARHRQPDRPGVLRRRPRLRGLLLPARDPAAAQVGTGPGVGLHPGRCRPLAAGRWRHRGRRRNPAHAHRGRGGRTALPGHRRQRRRLLPLVRRAPAARRRPRRAVRRHGAGGRDRDHRRAGPRHPDRHRPRRRGPGGRRADRRPGPGPPPSRPGDDPGRGGPSGS
jgi:hypothetical protein